MKMFNNQRYVISNGLAFAEESDMDRLSAWAEKGWFLDRFAMFGFILRRGEPQQRIYCLDIRQLQKEEEAEYRNIFADSGWIHICSSGDFHIFSAEPGTIPIHTDAATLYDKYIRVARISRISAFIMLLLTLGSIAVRFMSTQVWESSLIENVSFVALVLCIMGFVPATMVYLAYTWRVRKISK